MLKLSLESPVAFIFTAITYLSLCGLIVSTTGNFFHNTESLLGISISCYRSYRLQPSVTDKTESQRARDACCRNLSTTTTAGIKSDEKDQKQQKVLYRTAGASPYFRCLCMKAGEQYFFFIFIVELPRSRHSWVGVHLEELSTCGRLKL